MNQRERLLALVVLAVAILVGGGIVFKFLFLDALTAVYAQTADAMQDIDKKTQELAKEEQDQKNIMTRDPRLLHWQQLSLPDDKNYEQEIKKGAAPEDVKKRQESLLQVEYQRYLSDLAVRSGFAPGSLKVSSSSSDRKGGPLLTGKTPAYTRMSFTLQGQAGLDTVVRMLEDFYKTPLLHEVRNLTLTSKPPARTNAGPGFRQRGPAAPGAFPGAPGAAPPGIPGMPNIPGFNPAAIPGLAALPGMGPGGLFGTPAGSSGDLDVNLTVEALLVTGAEKRDNLLPDGKAAQVQDLAQPARTYSDILAKNMFTGIPAESKLSEDRAQVLAVIKLTSVWNNGRRWQATFYDQGKGGDEKKLRPPVIDEFSISDKYDNVLVRAKVLKIDDDGVIFQADSKYYRWRCGDFLGSALETPLKDSELKDSGVKTASAAE